MRMPRRRNLILAAVAVNAAILLTAAASVWMFLRLPDAQLALRKAEVALANDQPELAVELAEQALAGQGGNVEAVLLRARALAASGDLTAARTGFEPALQRHPGRPADWAAYSDVLWRQGDMSAYALAAGVLARRNDLPAQLAARTAVGVLALPEFVTGEQARMQLAWDLLEASADRGALSWRLAAARLYIAAANPAEARAQVENVAGNDEALCLLARCHLLAGRPAEAEHVIERLSVTAADDPTVATTLAAALMDLGRPTEAEQALTAAACTDPTNPTVLHTVATLSRHWRHAGRVRRVARTVGDAKPNDPGAIRLHVRHAIAADDRDALLALLHELAARGGGPDLAVLAEGYLAADMPGHAEHVASRRVENGAPSLHAGLLLTAARIARGEHRGTDAILTALAELAIDPAGSHRILGWYCLRTGRLRRAAKYLARAADLNDSDPNTAMLLGCVHERLCEFPAAELMYRRAAEHGGGRRKAAAMTAMGILYVRLGLDAQATEVVAELQAAKPGGAPNLLLLAGRALWTSGNHARAAELLRHVGDAAQEYPAASVLLARIDQRTARPTDARKRLRALLGDACLAGPTAAEVLALNLRDGDGEELFDWCDQAHPLPLLSPAMRARWLEGRLVVAANRRQWELADRTLAALLALRGPSSALTAARIALLATLGKTAEARSLYEATPGLGNGPVGPLTALIAGADEVPDANEPLTALIAAMICGDRHAARRAAAQNPDGEFLFTEDLCAMLAADDGDNGHDWRQLAAALIAGRCGLPQLTADLSRSVARRRPRLTLAHALHASSLAELGHPVSPALQAARRELPGSNLALALSARCRTEANDFIAAADDLARLAHRSPQNAHVQYALALLHIKSDRVDRAAESLRALAGRTNPYRGRAANDLAFILAERAPDRLAEARAVAHAAWLTRPNDAALLDTLGWIEHLRGDHEKALGYLATAGPSLRSTPAVHYHLGAVYLALGNRTWARYHLTQAARGGAGPDAIRAKAGLSYLRQ